MKCRCPLRLHPASFFRVNVADDSGNSIGRTIQTAYHLRRCPEPVVLAILYFQSVLNIIFCSIGFVRDRFQKQLHYPVIILRVQKVRPRIQFVRKIQNVMISKDLPERMAPVCMNDLIIFIALKIPQCRMDGFIDQRKVLIRPVHLYRQDPDRCSIRIDCIFFVETHIDGRAICCKDPAFPFALELTKACIVKECGIFLIEKILQRTLCLLHQGCIAVVQIMQQQITDRQDRQFGIIVPGNGSNTAIMIDRLPHGLKCIFSQPYRIGSVDFICKSSIEFHFHPRRVLIPPHASILVCLLWSTGILICDQACTV